MRVIAGSARGRILFSPSGNRVRPTADRVKEALFSALVSRFGSLESLAALDLFAGSGALGIEALSRGATSASFVDSHPDSLHLLRKNLDLTGFTGAAEIIRMEALKAVVQLSKGTQRFDIIFADPPYAETEIAEQLLRLLDTRRLLTERGVIVLETDRKAEVPQPEHLQLLSRKAYGDTAVWMFSAAT